MIKTLFKLVIIFLTGFWLSRLGLALDIEVINDNPTQSITLQRQDSCSNWHPTDNKHIIVDAIDTKLYENIAATADCSYRIQVNGSEIYSPEAKASDLITANPFAWTWTYTSEGTFELEQQPLSNMH